MKENEKIFFKMCYNLRDEKSIYDIVCTLSNKIPVKQMKYYVTKWLDMGFYDYGVNMYFGWFYPDKLPEKYRKLVTSKGEE